MHWQAKGWAERRAGVTCTRWNSPTCLFAVTAFGECHSHPRHHRLTYPEKDNKTTSFTGCFLAYIRTLSMHLLQWVSLARTNDLRRQWKTCPGNVFLLSPLQPFRVGEKLTTGKAVRQHLTAALVCVKGWTLPKSYAALHPIGSVITKTICVRLSCIF